MKGFFKNFTGAFKANARREYDHFNGQGAIDKANMFYRVLRTFLVERWNDLINKLIELKLKSVESDLIYIFEECKRYGMNPYDFIPDNIMMRVHSVR